MQRIDLYKKWQAGIKRLKRKAKRLKYWTGVRDEKAVD